MPRFATVFDLEFTAWEGSMARRWLAPGEFKEVVQIGAVRLDADTLEEVAALDLLVRPRINPVLSAYLEDLTGVTNARLKADGFDFAEAYDRFADFAARRDDLRLRPRRSGAGGEPAALRHSPMRRRCRRYINVTPWLRANGIEPKGNHACHVGPLCGAAFEGHEHDALDDARSVAAGIRALVGRGAENIFSF